MQLLDLKVRPPGVAVRESEVHRSPPEVCLWTDHDVVGSAIVPRDPMKNKLGGALGLLIESIPQQPPPSLLLDKNLEPINHLFNGCIELLWSLGWSNC